MQSTPSKRYHQPHPEERMTLASLVHQKYTAGAMAKVLKRSCCGEALYDLIQIAGEFFFQSSRF
jgi:hypothetical protein